MPQQDPIPDHLERTARAWAQYKRLMTWMVLAAFVTGLLALVYLKLTVGELPLHMMVATMAGVFFTVLLGTGLMGLVYFSNASGADDAATRKGDDDAR